MRQLYNDPTDKVGRNENYKDINLRLITFDWVILVKAIFELKLKVAVD